MKKLRLQIDDLRVDSFDTTSKNLHRGGSVQGNELSGVDTCLYSCGDYCTAAAGTCAAFTCADGGTCGNTYGNATCGCPPLTPACISGLCWFTDFCTGFTCPDGCTEQIGA